MTDSQHMDPNDIKLLGLHRAEFERAKADQARAWGAQACAAILACISVLVTDETVTYITTVLALIAAGLRCFFLWQSRRRHGTAERARRVLFLMQGLGWRMSGKEMVDLLASFSVSESEGQLWEDESYFDSVEDPGPKALAAIIQENAFWSKHLFSLSAKRYWLYSALSLALLLVVLLVIPGIPGQRWPIIIARFVCVALMFLVAIDLVGMAIAYSEAARVMNNVDDRLTNIRAFGSPEPDVMSVLGDYNAAAQGAPVIPTGIYKQHRERLRRLWEKRT